MGRGGEVRRGLGRWGAPAAAAVAAGGPIVTLHTVGAAVVVFNDYPGLVPLVHTVACPHGKVKPERSVTCGAPRGALRLFHGAFSPSLALIHEDDTVHVPPERAAETREHTGHWSRY